MLVNIKLIKTHTKINITNDLSDQKGGGGTMVSFPKIMQKQKKIIAKLSSQVLKLHSKILNQQKVFILPTY